MEADKNLRHITLYLFLFSFSIYLSTASVSNIHWSDVSIKRIEVTKSIIEQGNLSVPDGTGLKGSDGKDYSWFAIGSVLVALPFYTISRMISLDPEIPLSIINQLFGALTVILIFRFCICLGYSRQVSIFTALSYGFGTIAWYYSKDPGDHAIETFCILLSVYYMYRYCINRKISHILLSTFSAGFAIITRYTSILILPPLFIMAFLYSVKESDIKGSFRLLVKDISLFSAALLPFLGLIFWYNYYRFGSILETGYGLIAQRAGFDNFSLPLMEGLGGFLISPVKGFFYYSPFAILFFFSLKDFIKKHRDIALCFICIIVFYLLFLSRYISWHGDWAWGPRFIFVLTPFFIIPISTLLDSAMSSKKYFLRTIVIFIFIISFIIQLAAISVSLNKYFIDLHLKQKVEFAVAYGDGMQPIYMPQAEFYFKWRKTPIIAQFIFIKEIATKLKGYILSEPPESAIFAEEVKAQPYMNVFDFWWLYNFFIDRNYSGFIGVVLLLMIAVSCALRILKYTT